MPSQPNLGWTHSKHANLQLEMMWDMFNSLGGVNEKRVFSIVPFFGLGGDANWDFHNSEERCPDLPTLKAHGKTAISTLRPYSGHPVSAGLQFRFRLCKYVDFFAEARASFYADNWNNEARGASIDALVSAMGGFNFNIGGRG